MPLFWQLLIAAGILLLARAWWEPTRLDCHTIRIESAKPQEAESKTPAGPFRILFLSDLHAEFFRLPVERLLDACAKARPDLILFGGDLSGRRPHLPAALKIIRQIRELPELTGIPFGAVRGNHDSDQAVRGLQQLGIQVLENSGMRVTLQNQTWQIIGLEDLRTGHPDATLAIRQAEAAGIPPARRIVLAHNPDSLLDLPVGSAAFFLGGHFHGGQIWLPFRMEFFLLREEKLPRIGHYKGSFTWQGTPVYISRGLGCVRLPLRLFSKPELILLEIS